MSTTSDVALNKDSNTASLSRDKSETVVAANGDESKKSPEKGAKSAVVKSQDGKKPLSKKKLIFGILGVVLFVVVGWAIPAPQVLVSAAEEVGQTGHAAMIVLGTLMLAVCWWMGEVVASWITGLTMVIIWPLLGVVSIPKAFEPFSGSIVWLIIGGFSIAAAVTQSGLLRRIAYNLMKLFPANFRGQTLAMMVAGTVTSPLIPSANAKCLLGCSIAKASADAMEYENNSKGRTGLFMAAWSGFGLSVCCFISGSAFGYIVKGFMPEAMQAEITWGHWFVMMLPWLIVSSVLLYVGIQFLYKPSEKASISKGYINEELAKMGKMSRNEWICAVVLIVCLVLWIFEKQSGINATITTIAGALVLFFTGCLKPSDIANKVPWGLIIFIGCVLSLGNRFTDCGLTALFLSWFQPIFANSSNIYLTVALMIVLIVVVRFFIAAQAVVISLFIGIMMPVMSAMGFDVFCIALLVQACVNNFFTLYQNPCYLTSFGAMGDTIVQKDCIKGALLHTVVMFICSFVSIFVWQITGVL